MLFWQLNLKPCSDCSTCPHLEIYEGPDRFKGATLIKNRLITKICDNLLPGKIVSAGDSLMIKFHPKGKRGKNAFKIELKSIPG